MTLRTDRAETVRRLRARYLAGTLEPLLVPRNPDLRRLVADLFPPGHR